jgi:nucleotide-binding universal stress UspA family protein
VAQLPVILVALDGSEPSMHMVDYLSRMLSPRGVFIDLFHVQTGAPEAIFDLGSDDSGVYVEDIGVWIRDTGTRIQAFMETARGRFLEAGFAPEAVTITLQSRRIGIARDIIARANRGCAALVIGRRGFSRLPEFMMGSIAAKLAETMVRVPLAIIGGQPAGEGVMVAFDNSPCIRKGVDQVVGLFDRRLAEILLCHIVRPLSIPHSVSRPFFSPGNEAHWLNENSRRIVPAMVSVKERLVNDGFNPEAFRTAILEKKISRAEAIVGQADGSGLDTIIIGRHGITSISDFSMGRVARKVVQMAYQKAVWIV